jgi:hypothetical protein
MKMQEVRVKAKELGLKTGGMKKVDLIRHPNRGRECSLF